MFSWTIEIKRQGAKEFTLCESYSNMIVAYVKRAPKTTERKLFYSAALTKLTQKMNPRGPRPRNQEIGVVFIGKYSAMARTSQAMRKRRSAFD